MDDRIKFSLLIGTLNRPEILLICLNKLKKQTYKNFEVIIIDQSDNDKTEQIVKAFSGIDIKYKKVDFRGLSRARNAAIRMMSGTFFCLIDDDADYSNRYLENVVRHANEKVIVSGYLFDTNTKKGIVNYDKIRNRQHLTLREIIRLCPSAGLTFPSGTVNTVGLFDEEFGVGAEFGATEETDYLLRCRKQGYTILHAPDVYAEHPIILDQTPQSSDTPIEKVKRYAMGGGALYKKHLIYNNEINLIPALVDNIARLFIKKTISRSDIADTRYYGFIEGWKQYSYKKRD